MIYDKMPPSIQNVFEIGVSDGRSLKAWTLLFPFADVYGLDINPECKFVHPRVKFISADIKTFPAPDVKFDLVIDDGSHQNEDILAGWHIFKGRSRFYVIEDVDWNQIPELMETVRKSSDVNSVVQTQKDNGSRCIVASFDQVITW